MPELFLRFPSTVKRSLDQNNSVQVIQRNIDNKPMKKKSTLTLSIDYSESAHKKSNKVKRSRRYLSNMKDSIKIISDDKPKIDDRIQNEENEVKESNTQSVSIMAGTPNFTNKVEIDDLKMLKETVKTLEQRVSDLEFENNYLKDVKVDKIIEKYDEELNIYDESRPLNNDVLIK